jgi:hypothetical protein
MPLLASRRISRVHVILTVQPHVAHAQLQVNGSSHMIPFQERSSKSPCLSSSSMLQHALSNFFVRQKKTFKRDACLSCRKTPSLNRRNNTEYPALGGVFLNFPSLLKNQTPVLGANKRQLGQHFLASNVTRAVAPRPGPPKRLRRD